MYRHPSRAGRRRTPFCFGASRPSATLSGHKTETLQALGDDGQACVVVRSTPLILGSGLEGMPSFRLTSGEALIPTGEPNRFKLANKDVTPTVTEAA
jgi:hypothetical protein